MKGYTAGLHPRDREGRFIQTAGLDAWRVGGATRDPLLGKRPGDIDYVALHAPEDIKARVEAAGGRAEPLTVRDRLVGVRAFHHTLLPPEGVEIAPPRIEKSTGPGRHEFEIVPHPRVGIDTDDKAKLEMLRKDAERRDFTANAIFQRESTGEVFDPLGGQQDIERGLLRTTHADSFRDDPLRILRLARFASQHGLVPAEETRRQAAEHANAVTALTQKGVSGTVAKEMNKLLMGDHPGDALRLLRDTGALERLLPEFKPAIGFDQESKYHDLTADEHIFRVVDGVAAAGGSLAARWAALFHDVGKPEVAFRGKDGRLHFYGAPENDNRDHADVGAVIAERAMRRLGNLPAPLIEDVRKIVEHHMLTAADKPRPVKARRLRAALTEDQLEALFIHRRADMRAKGEDDDPANPKPTPELDRLEQMVKEAHEANTPRALADLKLTGDDLREIGYLPGPAMGKLLRDLLNEVIAQPSLNNRDWLLVQAQKRRRKYQGEHARPTTQESKVAEARLQRAALLGQQPMLD